MECIMLKQDERILLTAYKDKKRKLHILNSNVLYTLDKLKDDNIDSATRSKYASDLINARNEICSVEEDMNALFRHLVDSNMYDLVQYINQDQKIR